MKNVRRVLIDPDCKPDKHMFIYNGPVVQFNNCICDKWSGKTVAINEKKAKSNLVYQFKKQHNLTSNSKISLPGEIELADYLFYI